MQEGFFNFENVYKLLLHQFYPNMKKYLFSLLLLLNAFFLNSQTNLLNQGFEVLPFPPAGWSNVRITGPSLPGNWARYGNGIAPSQTPHTGSFQIRFNSHNFGAGTSGDLRTSVLDFTTAGTYTASFWMYRDGYAANDKLEVFVNTAQTSVGGTLLGTINRDRNQSPVVPSNGWYQYTFSIPPAFNTATNYIIFKGTSAFGNDLYVDDISIDRLEPAAPGCILTYSPINGTTGTCLNQTLTWDIVALASGYKMTIGSNSPDYNNIGNNVDLGVALTYPSLLNPSTTYGWKITPYNGYGEAAGCPINTFTTGTSACYCTPFYLDGSCGTEDYIDDFSTTSGATNITNMNTGCSPNPNNYTYFSAQTVTASQGSNFNISMQSGPDYAEGFGVWIDWNIDGDFDDVGEFVFNSGVATTTIVNGNIAVPITATPGISRMRVRCAYNYVPLAGNACTTFNEGETEDYNIQINACGTTVTYYADADGDTFGNSLVSITQCTGAPAPVGYVLNSTDCNDANAAIKPSAIEICNSIDDNCNVTIDEGVVSATITPGGPTSFCKGSNVVLSANAGVGLTYQWTKNGNNIGGATSINYTATQTGNYAVKVNVTGGCFATSATTVVTVNPTPAATITTPDGTDLCGLVNVRLKANNGAGLTYQWYKGATAIGGATALTYFATTTGNYKVKVTNATGCSKTSAATSVVKTCREELVKNNAGFNIYPNPAANNFFIELNTSTEETIATIEIFNLVGEEIYTQNAAVINGALQENIVLQNKIPSGLYLVKVTIGNQEFTKQLVIQQ